MTKAKELAIKTQELLEHKYGDWHDLKASVYELIEAVLSEPDKPDGLKGWIEVTFLSTKEEDGIPSIIKSDSIQMCSVDPCNGK